MTRIEQLGDSIKNRDYWRTVWLCLYMIAALSLAGFHFYTAFFGVLEAWQQRATHLSLALFVAFILPFVLSKPGEDRAKKAVSFVMLMLAGYYFYYLMTNYPALVFRQGMPNQTDIIMCAVVIVMLLVGAKMYMGWPLPILASIFIIYAFVGPYMPGVFRHGGFSVNMVVDRLFITLTGIYGAALSASAVFIALFIIFGNFLIQTKVGDFFVDFSTALAGKYTGGPAKVAVIGSALMGTIHGSAPGNVATTGNFTIPMMKKLGYKPDFAAGVEASASTGGIIVPPVMGATAFIMAEMTGIPYSRIILAALLPALLYFGAVFFTIHLEAKKEKLLPLPKDQLPDVKKLLLKEGYMLLPIITIVVVLVMGYTPMRAGIIAIVATAALSMFRKSTRLNFKRLITALEGGSKEIVTIAIACGTAGIIAGLISLTGLGIKLSQAISAIAGGSVFVALLMVMVVCIILGMGMPVSAAFVLVAATTSTFLINLGLPVLTAFMFILYYATFSAITPPVPLAAFTAAGIAGADHIKTCGQALRLALSALIVPFLFVYSPGLLWEGTALQIIISIVTGVIGIACVSIGVHGWSPKGPVHVLSRIALVGAALLTFNPLFITDLIGLGVVIVVFFVERHRLSKRAISATGKED